MREDLLVSYLSELPSTLREKLVQVNSPGLAALKGYLALSDAVAILGPVTSAPLYPPWNGLIRELVPAAGLMDERQAMAHGALAGESPDEVVKIVRDELGVVRYREALRQVLRVRTDPDTGRSWTPIQELVCRCAFKAVVTTNYDPGILNARMRVRPHASATGFTTWDDELALDRWRTGDVFGEAELPVLYAHGQHNRPNSVVLSPTEYRRAYAGKLPQVLATLLRGHLAWLGFSFADQRIAAILREIADRTGTRIEPGSAPRHVAIMAWDPGVDGSDLGVLTHRAETTYGAQLVVYPAPGGDHSALVRLLAGLADDRFPPAAELPASPAQLPGRGGARSDIPARWVPGPNPVEHFTGRAEELARLDQWAADPQVALIGVTAWGGAGKTALVTHWVQGSGAVSQRPGLRGVFGWSFYADPSPEHWAEALLSWACDELGIAADATDRPMTPVLSLLQELPLLLVLDGLERVQEGPAGDGFGRLLDGTLREVLVGACQQPGGGLIILTSRFPFADLETFDGDSARMLEVPPFTPAEGAALLASGGGDWLAEQERRALVRAVDGHALASGVLAGLLAARPPASDLAALRADLAAATRTDARVGRVLEFYAARMAEPDQYLLAAVSLFARPVPATAVLAVARHEAFGSRLAGWTPGMVQAAVRGRLAGLASWHPDGTISAHPLVRDTFRPLVMAAAGTAADAALAALPTGPVTRRSDALRVVEAVELLLDAAQWEAADNLYISRTGSGHVWKQLPAARFGQRAASAFVATSERRQECTTHLGSGVLSFYISTVGVCALLAGDTLTAREFLSYALKNGHDVGEKTNLPIALQNLAECLAQLGEVAPAREAAAEALERAIGIRDQAEIRSAHAYLAWISMLAGNTLAAEEQFTAADRIEVTTDPEGQHLYSLRGIWWAEFLARTGRTEPARALTERNRIVAERNSWRADTAYCDRVLGRLALNAGDLGVAGERLAAAAECFREADYLTELAITLTDQAEHARLVGNLDAANNHVSEAIIIAAPRGLILTQSAALAIRARIGAAQANTTPDPELLYQGRDAADAALRLAVRHNLVWLELDAIDAHAILDDTEATDRGWAAKANALRVRLVPPGLDPDPLTTIKDQVSRENLLSG